MKNIAIITARGGSKRIPRKNIKNFCGKPIILYSIEAALNSAVFDEVMVSTDDKEIADISKKAGANVPFFRSKETSNDYAVTSDVIQEVLIKYRQMGKDFDYGCCIYPTAPFVTSNKLNYAMSMINKMKADTVIPVVAYSFPPQRAIVIRDGMAKMQFPENLNKRSQDFEPIYHDCGQFYVFNVSSFLEAGMLMGKNVIPMVMDELEVQDIDNLEDWKIAEMKYKAINSRG
ncbi:MAG: pseudaminic acid cytidylyltransferase [Lachnospiraceae bacterium]|nr:pseudaminic acid cytidylyltransferase [Lachnospiraceae bacterium]